MDWAGWLEKGASQYNCYKGAKTEDWEWQRCELLKIHEDPTEKKKGQDNLGRMKP